MHGMKPKSLFQAILRLAIPKSILLTDGISATGSRGCVSIPKDIIDTIICKFIEAVVTCLKLMALLVSTITLNNLKYYFLLQCMLVVCTKGMGGKQRVLSTTHLQFLPTEYAMYDERLWCLSAPWGMLGCCSKFCWSFIFLSNLSRSLYLFDFLSRFSYGFSSSRI